MIPEVVTKWARNIEETDSEQVVIDNLCKILSTCGKTNYLTYHLLTHVSWLMDEASAEGDPDDADPLSAHRRADDANRD